jgi:hypothetical protein
MGEGRGGSKSYDVEKAWSTKIIQYSLNLGGSIHILMGRSCLQSQSHRFEILFEKYPDLDIATSFLLTFIKEDLCVSMKCECAEKCFLKNAVFVLEHAELNGILM